MNEIRHLPQSDEAERGMLCSILLAPRRVLDEFAWLIEEHFWNAMHRLIFKRMRGLDKEGVAIDFVTLTQKMEDAGECAEIHQKTGVSGAGFITDIFTFVGTAANAVEYAAILHEKLTRRRIIDECYKLIDRAYGDYGSAEGLLVDAEKALADLSHNTTQKTVYHVNEVTPAVADEIEAAYHSRGDITGLSSGLADFDRMTLGLKGAQYVVCAARPSNGKTAFLTQALAAFAGSGVPVGFFSLEMSKEQIVKRLVCNDVGVNIYRAKDGFFSRQKMDEIAETIHKINGLPFYIDDTPGLTIYELRARARRMKEKFGLGAIGIDYVQCLKSTSKRAADNRVNEVAECSMGIKEATKELAIPILVCAQLNREAERMNTRPKLADLKESGQIEQDADIVVILHRPDKGNVRLNARAKKAHQEDSELDDLDAELLRRNLELIECVFAKQRDGPVGVEGIGFKAEYTRFESLTAKLYSSKPQERQKYGGRQNQPAKNGQEEEEYA